MSIPGFTSKGKLPSGLHRCSGDEFLIRFCQTDYRKNFNKTVSDIFDFAKQRNAGFLFFGGSFITATDEPGDIDCLMVFFKDEFIPPRTERLLIGGTKIDIAFGSLESRDIIDAYIHLFSQSRHGEGVGIIQVDLYGDSQEWEVKHPGTEEYEIVKRAYINREFIDVYEPNGILVTIHGLLSNAEWNKEIAPVASSQGWIFAPYIYNSNLPDLLVNPTKRSEFVDNFRQWIYDLYYRFEQPVSVIAHSFGTYIITAYLSKFEVPPVTVNSLILTGSILNSNFNWDLQRGKVARVLNEIAPNDKWVSFMPKTDFKKLVGMDNLFGTSGVDGFSIKSEILKQNTNNIFTHTNVIKRDTIETKWMPYLNANRCAHFEESKHLFKRHLGK